MKIFEKKNKQNSYPSYQGGYWGDYGEIGVSFSSGVITDNGQSMSDKLHYHRKGIIYFLSLLKVKV